MQPTFLDEVANILKSEYGDNISDLVLLVPNKRAVVFLKQAIANAYGKVIWSPEILAIQQFLRSQANLQFPEPLTLVLELYEVYQQEAKKIDPTWDESLETFFSWGEMLLKDFDEVDKYLIPAEKLFSNIQDLREIDAFFALTEEDKEALEQLWQALRGNKADRKELEERFLNLWNLMAPVYEAFRNRLKAKGYAYDGMAYRSLTESVQAGEFNPGQKKFIFIGFNALLKTEEVIFESLLSKGQSTIFWDVHPWYFCEDDRTPVLGNEPGKFIRAYHNQWKGKGYDSRIIFPPEKHQTIHIVSAPENIGQARFLGMELKNTLEAYQDLDWARQAVVLADEQMLFPTLQVLPSPAQFPNVTMGYPLKQAHIFHLIDSAIELLRNRKWHPEKGWLFGFKEVQKLLVHPYLQTLFTDSRDILKTIAEGNLILFPGRSITERNTHQVINTIFSPPPHDQGQENVQRVLAYLNQIIAELMNSLDGPGDLEMEFLIRLQETLTILSNTLTAYHQTIRTEALGRLLKQALRSIRIPFEGEPLKGLQVMGFLETRGLDFERVFILGANEGLLPDTSTGSSFVPYLLRKAFGMPTFEEKDAIYSYHFYRFLQRSSVIYLVYNGVISNGTGSKEASRFLKQIRFFLKDATTSTGERNITVIEHQATSPANVQKPYEIRIPNTDEIKAKLAARFSGKKAMSASALNSYRGCSLRFYFNYVAGLRKSESVDLTMPNNLFGTLLHSVLEQAYLALPTARPLTKAQILEQKDHLPDYLNHALKEVKLSKDYLLQGENLLKKEAILKQSGILLERDAEEAPFILVGTEQKLYHPTGITAGGIHYELYGTLDRVDEVAGTVRILDYKTGKVDISARAKIEDLFEKADNDLMFQGYLYALLQQRNTADQDIKVGFYALKKPSSGVQYLEKGNVIHPEVVDKFEAGVQDLLGKISTEDFIQTDDLKKCEYCDYASICRRDTGA